MATAWFFVCVLQTQLLARFVSWNARCWEFDTRRKSSVNITSECKRWTILVVGYFLYSNMQQRNFNDSPCYLVVDVMSTVWAAWTPRLADASLRTRNVCPGRLIKPLSAQVHQLGLTVFLRIYRFWMVLAELISNPNCSSLANSIV